MTARFSTDAVTRGKTTTDPTTGLIPRRALAPQVAGAALRGSARVRAMASSAPYAAPTMTAAPTITQGTSATSGNTRSVSYTNSLFRWPGRVDTAGGAATPRHYTKADGTGVQASVPASQVAFDFDGDQFDFIISAKATLKWRLWVNEQAHAATMQAVPSATGTLAYINVNLGSTSYGAPRRIIIELEDASNPLLFYGLAVKPIHSVYPPLTPSPRVMIVGDSYGLGIGATNYSEGYAKSLGRLMGWADTWAAFLSVPSTGLVNIGGAVAGTYGSRLAPDVLPFAPDILLLQGTLNDNPWVGQGKIGPALTSYVQTVRYYYPDCLIAATAPLFVASAPVAYTQIRDEMLAAAAPLNVPFLDIYSPTGFFNGSGNSSTPNNTGNADLYRASDNTHPVSAGHWQLANILAGLLRPVVGQYE